MQGKDRTLIGLHGISNILGKNALSKVKEVGKELTTTEYNVLMAIIKAFTDTNYMGNEPPVISNTNPYVKILPKIRITRERLLGLMSLKKDDSREITATMNALKTLSKTILHFRYDRLCYDEGGMPIKKKGGGWKKETVETEESIFSVTRVYHENTKRLKHIEITLATIFIDQKDTYYLSIPDSLQKRLKDITKGKRQPTAVQYFILYLFKTFEILRRNKKSSRKINIRWDELAKIVRIPELSIKKKRGRVISTLDKAAKICLQLSLLEDWSFSDDCYILYCSRSSYFQSNLLENDSNQTFSIPSSSEIISSSGKNLLPSNHWIYQWKFSDGSSLQEVTVKRWLKTRSLEDIQLCMKLYQKKSSDIQPGKHEAYLETLVKKNEGVNKLKNMPVNRKHAMEFLEETRWKAMRIDQRSVFIRMQGNYEESLDLCMDPSRFSTQLENYYKNWTNIHCTSDL